jgi:peptidoglycan/LPS O-acetylase OafA/YrhL
MNEFRTDVEGLRALAIAIVLLAHAGLPIAAGGYVGVDVFFVISGFLITRLLVGERERTGTLSLPRFYARRVRRLMPQALTAIVAVAIVSRLVLSPLEADAVLSDVQAAGVYAMNWHLSAQSVDYFASGAADGPLDHFWSLAVEEQFYLVWPLLLLVLGRRWVAPALAAICAASLVYAVQRAGASPEQAYFSTGTRAWELALGGLLALALAGRRLGRWPAHAAGWAGLAAIAFATVAFGPDTRMPALPALLPALGAAALVAAGTSATPAAPTRLLSLRPVCFVGRISYAWYIWHWPVLVLAVAVVGPLSPAAGLAVVAASFVPTIITHRWIEEPIRRSRIRVRTAVLAAPATAVLVLAAAVVIAGSIPSPPTLAAGRAEGAAQLQRTFTLQRSATALRPTPRKADDDRGRSYEDGCLVDAAATSSPRCVYGDRRSRATVVLFGDSHAMQFFPALEPIALRRHWRLVQLTKSGCPAPAVDVIYTPLNRAYPECDAWRADTYARIARERPALVVVAASVDYTVVEHGRRLGTAAGTAALAAGYRPTLQRLRRMVPRVAVLVDAPKPPWDVPDCVSKRLHQLRRCAFPRGPAVARAATIAAGAASVRGVHIIDPADRFCLPRLCPAVIGDVLVYRQTGHITATYAATLAPWLSRRLPALK